jgi:hypothetical protein
MKKENKKQNAFQNLLNYLNNHVNTLNNSKLFAGLMIIILNIASRFVTIKLSKTAESYLKFTFSRDILIFAIAWMGTRDIYIALVVVIGFIIVVDFIFNENSQFCVLSENFTDYHTGLLNDKVTDEDVKKAKETLTKAEKQKEQEKEEEKEQQKKEQTNDCSCKNKYTTLTQNIQPISYSSYGNLLG